MFLFILFSIDRLGQMLMKSGWFVDSIQQIQDRRSVKSEADFQVSPYWPSYEHYLLYRETGSLCVLAHKPRVNPVFSNMCVGRYDHKIGIFHGC